MARRSRLGRARQGRAPRFWGFPSRVEAGPDQRRWHTAGGREGEEFQDSDQARLRVFGWLVRWQGP